MSFVCVCAYLRSSVCVCAYLRMCLCMSISEQAVKQLQKERKRMLQKISVNEEQREEAKEELSQVAAMHANTKVNLEELEQQTFMEEQRMRVRVERDMHLTCHPYTLTCSMIKATDVRS